MHCDWRRYIFIANLYTAHIKILFGEMESVIINHRRSLNTFENAIKYFADALLSQKVASCRIFAVFAESRIHRTLRFSDRELDPVTRVCCGLELRCLFPHNVWNSQRFNDSIRYLLLTMLGSLRLLLFLLCKHNTI